MARKKFRTLEQVLTNDFFLWPDEGINSDPGESVRHRAIAEVLCSIPEDDYEKLKETFKKGYGWFIPPCFVKGLIQPFYATVYPEEVKGTTLQSGPYVPVIYLSPILEETEWNIVLVVVAREIAHVVLGHKLPGTEEEYKVQEVSVFDYVCKWGFEQGNIKL
ncbi:MAG TPA: hypothetical protein VHT73_11500 [Thermodesulfobacteriota bacterium]|nr:hypothetical protein [Thermodesulfobacteriota bacterium]